MTIRTSALVPDQRTPRPAPGSGPRRVRAFGGYQPGLDGIRGLGMFAMLGYHADMRWADGAFLSLSQFFTLSGFLITAILLQEGRERGTIDLRRFWTRRFRRLAPAALLGLAGVALFGATVASRQQAENLPREVLGVLTYVVNWVFVSTDRSYTDLFAAPSPVNHYWSLAVEEQYYLVIPVVLLLLVRLGVSRIGLAIAFGGAAVASAAWMVSLHIRNVDLDRIYYGTDTRLSEVMIGALLAVILDRTGTAVAPAVRRAAGAAAVVAFAVLAWMWIDLELTDSAVWRGAFQLNAIGTAVLIVAIVVGDRGVVCRLYETRPLVALGRLSYGVYIYHFPIFLWLDADRTGLEQWPLFAVRVVVSIAVAYASQRLVEAPIRNGATFGLRPFARVLAYPVIGAAILGVVVLTANTDGDDPLETIRVQDDTPVPIATADGVLDILVVHDPAVGEPVVREIEALAADEPIVVESVPLGCDVTSAPAFGCAGWLDAWPSLIADVDPDVVVFYADTWPGPDPAALGDGDAVANLTATLDAGLDVLASRDAVVVFASSGTDFEGAFRRSLLPFQQAVVALDAVRDDLVVIPTGAVPDPDVVGEDVAVARTAEVLLESAALYQRADRAGETRVLVVGDSQARSLGFGLERWGARNDVWVWNAAVNGCGLLDEGETYGSGSAEPVKPECLAVIDALERQVASFDPDVVIVFSSIWDLTTRRLEDWPEPLTLGDDRFDAYIEREYLRAVDVMSAGGASIVWIQPPCATAGVGVGAADTFGGPMLTHLNETVLPEVQADARGVVSLFDLNAVLCPGGRPVEEADGVRPIRGDGVHFNVEGSAWFADNYARDLLALGGF